MIRTANPDLAIQQIMGQISTQTGLMLASSFDSGSAARLAPVVLVQGFSETAVINLILTPRGAGEFAVSCSFVFDQRPPGSVDGTPAATAQMKAAMEYMTGDSGRSCTRPRAGRASPAPTDTTGDGQS